ncbi:MAG: succinylglutamate desuccinylase/aspartoacylase family protein, partial [Gammaproteobacteria bacterium]|nr:succinylglutamate desuccinylase/aspartoacylase family protein [Gammaproteobacteria bacterium]
ANPDNAKTGELAKAFGAAVILDSKIRDGSLRACAADRGFPMLIYEAGEALRFDEVSIRAGLRGVINVMRYLEMLPKRRNAKTINPVIADSTSWVRAPSSGIVSHKAALGTRIDIGQRLAIIGDPLGEAETQVVAPFDGIVIGRSNLPLAHEGDALFNVAAFQRLSRAEDNVEQFVATHTD